MTILYTVGNGLYINLTNHCPCRCQFCVRENKDGLGTGDNLWLEKEPSTEQVIATLQEVDLDDYSEIVFCGYGEPTCRFDTLLDVCDYLRSVTKKVIRLNTNGLSDLINQRPTAKLLEGRIDSISISLNAPSAEEYNNVTRPSFGKQAYEAMLSFAEECIRYVPQVCFSVVNVIDKEQIDRCQKLADQMGIPLRIRDYIT